MKSWKQRCKNLQKQEVYRQRKCKNWMRRLWLIIYQTIRHDKGLRVDSRYKDQQPIVKKFAVIANRLYKRRSL